MAGWAGEAADLERVPVAARAPGERELVAGGADARLRPLVEEAERIGEGAAGAAGDVLDRRAGVAQLGVERGVVELAEVGVGEAVGGDLHPSRGELAGVVRGHQLARRAGDERVLRPPQPRRDVERRAHPEALEQRCDHGQAVAPAVVEGEDRGAARRAALDQRLGGDEAVAEPQQQPDLRLEVGRRDDEAVRILGVGHGADAVVDEHERPHARLTCRPARRTPRAARARMSGS